MHGRSVSALKVSVFSVGEQELPTGDFDSGNFQGLCNLGAMNIRSPSSFSI
jgi:hypothetical protein